MCDCCKEEKVVGIDGEDMAGIISPDGEMLDKVVIGCHEYDIECSTTEFCVEGKQALGLLDPRNGVIKLYTEASTSQIKHTLVHEVVHGIDEFMQIGLSEELTDKIAAGMLMVIKQNPLLIDFLMSEE